MLERNISSGSTDPGIGKQLLESEPVIVSKVSEVMVPALVVDVQSHVLNVQLPV